MKTVCSFRWERGLWKSGHQFVAGVDEAGRGPLAGPVVAAAVIFLRPLKVAGLDDSKKLDASLREDIYQFLTTSSDLRFAICVRESTVVDRLNILRATHDAMAGALRELEGVSHALVDGLSVKGLPVEHTSIIKGDGISFSIAAASILAKVTRDRLMERWHGEYPVYGFDRHKGYPTPEHLDRLRVHGPCPIHRRSFAPVAELCSPRLF